VGFNPQVGNHNENQFRQRTNGLQAASKLRLLAADGGSRKAARGVRGELFMEICYLDSNDFAAMIISVRTTVTIDADTEALLREEVKRTRRPFKEVLNRAIQRALAREPSGSHPRVEPLFHKPFPMEFEATGFNRLADALDDEDTLRELRR